MNKKGVLIFLLVCLVFISASCDLSSLNPATPMDSCCIVSDDFNNLEGCVSGINQVSCNAFYNKGYNTVWISEEGKTCSDVPSCSFAKSCLYSNVELGLLISADLGTKGCFSDSIFECKTSQDTGLNNFEIIEDCAENGKTCYNGVCIGSATGCDPEAEEIPYNDVDEDCDGSDLKCQ